MLLNFIEKPLRVLAKHSALIMISRCSVCVACVASRWLFEHERVSLSAHNVNTTPTQVRFREDLAACSKISHKRHSKKTAPRSSSAHDSQIDQGRIPYGCGVVAGPTTIVAGVRAGVKFGFETTPKAPVVRSAPSGRIALGTYGAEELRAMFSDSSMSRLSASLNRTMPSSFGSAHLEQDVNIDKEQRNSQSAKIMSEDESTSRAAGELLVALFKYNGISIEHGYIEADKDGDGKVSEADLVSFCRDVHLECTDDDVRAFCRSLDPEALGVIEPRAWSNALQTFENSGERILASRGVTPGSADHDCELDRIIADVSDQVLIVIESTMRVYLLVRLLSHPGLCDHLCRVVIWNQWH